MYFCICIRLGCLYTQLLFCGFLWQSTEKVLILEYMDGIRLNDSASLEAYGIDKQKIVEEITRAYAHQIYVDGFFNGDPHPGTLSYICDHFNVNKCRLIKKN